MKLVATAAQEQGVEIEGVSVEFLKEKARKDATKMTIAKDLAERKKLMIEKSDSFLILPGGIGTLDETMSLLEYQKHGSDFKPVVFLNIDDFYEGTRAQLYRMFDDGFLTKTLDQVAFFASSPEQAINMLGAHRI